MPLLPRHELPAPRAGRDAGPLAKRMAERGLRRVARQVRGLRERCALAQKYRRFLHAETRQIAERWLADELCEARREDRAREADLLGERGHGPRRLGAMVHRAERRCGIRIAEGAEKAAAVGGDARKIRAEDLDEDDVRHPEENELGAGPVRLHLAGDELDVLEERRHPLLHFGPHSDDRPQHGEDLPRERIVEHESAGDEVRLRTLRADFELHDDTARVALRDVIDVHGGAAWMVAQHVRVAERQDREIAAGEGDVWLVRVVYTEPRTTAHHVVEADAARPSRKG